MEYMQIALNNYQYNENQINKTNETNEGKCKKCCICGISCGILWIFCIVMYLSKKIYNIFI